MSTMNPILDAARARLAEIERQTADLNEEAATLRRMIVAGEGRQESAPAPLPVPFAPWPNPGPFPAPYRDPIAPWIVGAPRHAVIYCGPSGAGTGVDVRMRPDGATILLRRQEPCVMGAGSVDAYVPPLGVRLCVDASGALPTLEGATLYNGYTVVEPTRDVVYGPGVRIDSSLRFASSN